MFNISIRILNLLDSLKHESAFFRHAIHKKKRYMKESNSIILFGVKTNIF